MNKTFLFLIILLCYAVIPAQKKGERPAPPSAQRDTTFNVPADSLAGIDSAAVNDSAKAVRDTLRPIHYEGFIGAYHGENKLTRTTIERIDYRFAGDFTNYMPFGFLRDLGYVGRPSESFMFGLGNGSISYLQDGVPIDNRFQETLDLNIVQTEAIDSLEVASLPRSFFYNNASQPVSINYITRDVVDMRPYTRVRFYQGQNSEGYIDGVFSGYVMKRMNVEFRFTNQTVDSSQTNSTLSNWHLNTRLRYMPSNFVNVIANYDYSKVNVDLNGGVDYVELQADNEPQEYDNIMYSDIDAPVVFKNRYRKTTGHNFSGKVLLKFNDNISTDITAYYQKYLDEFRQDENDYADTIATIRNDNSYNTYGIKLHHLVDYPFANLEVLGGYEKNDFNIDLNQSLGSSDILYAGGKLEGAFFDELISPAFYAKYTETNDGGALSYGFDASFKLSSGISLYAGYSDVDRSTLQSLTGEWKTQGYNPIQLGVKLNSKCFTGSLSYINMNYNNYAFAVTTSDYDSLRQSQVTDYVYKDINYSGLNLTGSLSLWNVVMLRTNTTYYFDQSSMMKNNIPSISSFGGIYYVDSLFSGNLDLIMGLNYKFYGERNYLNYDYQLLQPIYYQNTSSGYERINTAVVDPSFQLDFFVSGRIQRYATVFVAIENILDQQYYVVPYYTMPSTGYRLGITWEFMD